MGPGKILQGIKNVLNIPLIFIQFPFEIKHKTKHKQVYFLDAFFAES